MKQVLLAFLAGVAIAAQVGTPDPRARLLEAVRRGDKDEVERLLAGDASLVDAQDAQGVQAARLALYYGQREIAELFAARGARMDFWTAAAMGRVERLGELLRQDAELVNRFSSDGATALGFAAFFGRREAVDLLLNAGADLNRAATNPAFPFVPLHSAMSAGHWGIVELLLDRGADVNAREGGGMTVLHEAAGLGNLDFVRTLLARGANPAAKTDDGKLPEDFARERKAAEVAELLQRARGREK